MRGWLPTRFKVLFVPGGLLLATAAMLVYSGWLTLALPALTFLCFSAIFGGMLLAWRFHSSRIFFALTFLFLAREAALHMATGFAFIGNHDWSALTVVAVLVSLNFIVIALMHERGFTISSTAPIALLLFAECVVAVVLGSSHEGSRSLTHHQHGVTSAPLSQTALLAFAVAGIFLLARTLSTRKLADSALLWSLTSFFLSIRFSPSSRTATVYSTTAACILVVAIIENSYLLAYHDELTTLPSRRAFNDALLGLQDPFSIAMVDIDHFKRFNDTYGHDTGDQVLRLVAAKLSRVTGGGQAYRCGGEEFAILFPGKSTSEVASHLEQLRAAIESSEFRIRTVERRQVPRGPDRRGERIRRRTQKGHAIRQLAQEGLTAAPTVTVSIGVATSTKEKSLPDLVLQAADKALYRAKANGRNRIETASTSRRRTSAKAAGIA